MKKQQLELTIGWLYPDLMSTYGDRGNIIALTKRCEWRGINVTVVNIDQTANDQQLKTIDLLFGGGSQDREQAIVMQDLRNKAKSITKLIENNVPALFVCGAPQLMGNYYEPAEGKRIEGLGIFDMISIHPGPTKPRLIGNVVADVSDYLDEKYIAWEEAVMPVTRTTIIEQRIKQVPQIIVGFENHGGRTYLGKTAKPFAKVIKGYGNNGEDGTEGVVYKNAIGCYFHGPLLPKNPAIADYLIAKALEIKYQKKIKLASLDDTLEQKAKAAIVKKLGIQL